MIGHRYTRILTVSTLIAFAAPGAYWAAQRAQPSAPPPTSGPRIPAGESGPIGGPGIGAAIPDNEAPRVDPRVQLKEAQKKLNSDVEHLLQLATELKTESDKTKETDVLSLPLIHKAEEIEKLAKQIKDLARAN